MFEVFTGISQAWREIEHISEITGFSVTLLVGLAALAYLDPGIRKWAIRGGIFVILAYVGGMTLYGLGAKDVRGQWNAADAKADKERVTRDKTINDALETKYAPQITALTKQSADLQKQVEAYEKKLLADKSAGASCQLGADALRLRQ
ncbi:MAG: hypothetical protein ABSA68_13390 [Xanthobacteraceae bacterium]|jgi:hypothetical protein